MKNVFKLFFAVVLGWAVLGTTSLANAASSAEDKDIQDLALAESEGTITSAMSRLERMYHEDSSNTNSIPALKNLLDDKRSGVRRKAARLLGIFHAQLTDAELKEVCAQLKADDWGEVQSGLKSLRDLDATSAVPDVLPCLKHSNPQVVRDACRTLAVIGDKSVIPSIEPLLTSTDPKIKQDAQDAIDILKSKP